MGKIKKMDLWLKYIELPLNIEIIMFGLLQNPDLNFVNNHEGPI